MIDEISALNDLYNKLVQEKRTIMTEQKICGFSMGAPQLRKCIEGECRFWRDTENEIREMIAELVDNGICEDVVENEAEEMRKTLGKGYCVFEGYAIS
jgi:predicted transcriptional regulator